MKQTLAYKSGHALSFTDAGDRNGYPLLIQHGLIASIEDEGLFERLMRAGRRLISIARPGYGDSSPYLLESFAEWADIAGFLVDALGFSQFDVLGMSSGAPYSYALGYRFPERVRNIYIFSGIPALYEARIFSLWPYEVNKGAGMAELEELAYALFFAHLSDEDLQQADVKDSLRNQCFGVAQDLRLRFVDWGFTLGEVRSRVFMEHSKDDANVPFATAALTAGLLPQCEFRARESGGHFSSELLDDFIKAVVLGSV